jgi:hypothetical protein
VEGLCDVLSLELDDRRRQELAGMREPELEALFEALRRQRRWPAP